VDPLADAVPDPLAGIARRVVLVLDLDALDLGCPARGARHELVGEQVIGGNGERAEEPDRREIRRIGMPQARMPSSSPFAPSTLIVRATAISSAIGITRAASTGNRAM